MAKTFNSVEELKKNVEEKMKIATYNAMNRLKEMLIKELMVGIYEDTPSPSYYKRTYELVRDDFWQVYKPYIRGGKIYSNLVPAKTKLQNQPNLNYYSNGSISPSSFIHGNVFFGGITDPYHFMQILENDNRDNPFNFASVHRSFNLASTVKKLKKAYPKLFAEELKKVGVVSGMVSFSNTMIFGNQSNSYENEYRVKSRDTEYTLSRFKR